MWISGLTCSAITGNYKQITVTYPKNGQLIAAPATGHATSKFYMFGVYRSGVYVVQKDMVRHGH